MKTNKKTGAIICGKCDAELKVARVSRVLGFPKKVIFRCSTKMLGTNNEVVSCTGGFMIQNQQVKNLSDLTKKYYKLGKK